MSLTAEFLWYMYVSYVVQRTSNARVRAPRAGNIRVTKILDAVI